MKALGRRDWAVAFSVALFAGAVRAWALNAPESLLLDEFWYARDGCFYWHASAEACGMARLVAPDRDVATWLARYGELTPEHPPLAKWLIGAPMAVLHYGAGPARLAPLAAGALTVLLLYLLTRKAFGSLPIAAGAALGLAVDFAHFVHSRVAMLDVFTALFAVGAFLFLVLDREQALHRHGGRRWWRIAAAVAAGGAAATKLSGGAVALAVLLLVWRWGGEEREEARLPANRFGSPQFASQALVLIAVAMATYAATYIGRLDATLFTWPWADDAWLRAWWQRQLEMISLQAGKPTGMSQPWELPMTSPPLVYFIRDTQAGIREVVLFGNPMMWWGGFAAAAIATFDWVSRKRKPYCDLVVVAFLTGMAGWLSLTLTGRTVHLYHAVPVTPFLYLALAYLAARVWNRRPFQAIAVGVVVTAIGAFVYFVPILNAHPLRRSAWEPRGCSAMAVWLSHAESCGLDSSTQSR